jgi:secreted trypsin-like serine protease
VADSESDTSSVVKLRIETRDGSIGTCTGTVISTTAVLTAGHCFAYSDWSRVIITAVSAGRKVDVQSTSVVVHPNFRASLSEGLFFNDAAIVKVGSALPVPPLPLLVSRAPQVGEDSTVAGYGQTENGGAAVDDVVAGQAVIRSVTDNHLRIDYRDGESHPCKGDSGGALLVQQGEGLAIAGVVSQSDPSVTADQICEQGEDKTLYTNTQQASVSNFILAQARGAATK